MKYEKPQLIDMNKLHVAFGVCENGDSNIEVCGPGETVVPGCMLGGIPTAVKR